jgi:hypothetical protein
LWAEPRKVRKTFSPHGRREENVCVIRFVRPPWRSLSGKASGRSNTTERPEGGRFRRGLGRTSPPIDAKRCPLPAAN